MKYRSLYAVAFVLCAGQAAFADLTVRHTIEIKLGSFLPPAATEAMKTQLAEQLPKELLIQIKGRKVLTSMGRLVMLADYVKGTITLMDPKTQRFATSPLADYADKIAAVQKQKMPAMPPAAQEMINNIQFDVKTDRTGKTAVIQGIGAEETVLNLSIEIPNPSGVPMKMRMEMHQWIATPEEMNRVPALKELDVYASLPKEGVDPVATMTKVLANFPGMAEKVRGAMGDLTKNVGKATLRVQTAIYMPSIAAMMGSAAADQPFTEYSMELAELSSAPLPDSRFDVPANYQSALMEDLIATLFPMPTPAAPRAGETQAQIPAGERPRIVEPLPPGVYRVGNGVTPPAVLEKTEPTYTPEARAAKISGSVLLGVVVGTDGKAQQMKVLRSLDPGLDQKAMETVGNWTFKPGMKDGKPVMVQAQIEVNFRLM
jgi:TonB family protein